jgi:hypothetical protein
LIETTAASAARPTASAATNHRHDDLAAGAHGAAVGGLGLAASVGLYLGATVVAGEFDRACFANGVAVTGEVCGARFQRDQETIDALQWGAVGSLGLVAVGSTLAIIGALSPSRRVVVAATTRQLVVGGSL